jgi:hypothetical protein
MEVCKRNGEGTFAGTHGNGRDAPKVVILAPTIEPPGPNPEQPFSVLAKPAKSLIR